MAPPGIINGAVISNGNAQVTGGSDVAEINYDQAMLNQVRLQLGQLPLQPQSFRRREARS